MARTDPELIKINERSNDLLQILKEEGYKITASDACLFKRSRGHDWSASNPKRGVRLKISQGRYSDSGYSVKATLRTDIGTYKLGARFGCSMNAGFRYMYVEGWLEETDRKEPTKWQSIPSDEVAQWIRDLKGQAGSKRLKTKDDLRPLIFSSSLYYETDTERVVIQQFLKTCWCESLAIITDRLDVVVDGVQEPGSDCWFNIGGRTLNGENVNILVNFEMTEYYALNKRKDKFYITPNLRPRGGKIDFNDCSMIDREAIKIAIERYLAKLM